MSSAVILHSIFGNEDSFPHVFLHLYVTSLQSVGEQEGFFEYCNKTSSWAELQTEKNYHLKKEGFH